MLDPALFSVVVDLARALVGDGLPGAVRGGGGRTAARLAADDLGAEVVDCHCFKFFIFA